MQISVKNVIDNGLHEEIIHEIFEGNYTEIADQQFLSYIAEDGKRVVIKFDETELIMTRYADKVHKMRFTVKENTSFNYGGIYGLKISTETYKVKNNNITVIYTIMQNEETMANYQLEITYGN